MTTGRPTSAHVTQSTSSQTSVSDLHSLSTGASAGAASAGVTASTGVTGPRHGCKLSTCSHCSLGGRLSARSSVPTIFRMQLSQPSRCRHRSSSNCSQTSQMMVCSPPPVRHDATTRKRYKNVRLSSCSSRLRINSPDRPVQSATTAVRRRRNVWTVESGIDAEK